jgi:YggT family protein
MAPYHPIRSNLDKIVQPMISPVRKYIQPIQGIDFSPLILLIIVQLAGKILVGILAGLS